MLGLSLEESHYATVTLQFLETNWIACVLFSRKIVCWVGHGLLQSLFNVVAGAVGLLYAFARLLE